MPGDAGHAKFRLDTDTAPFKRGLTEAERAAQVSSQRITKKLSGIGTALSGAGRSLTMGVTLPILGVGAAAIKSEYDFSVSMNKINLLTNVAEGSAKELEKAVMDVSIATATLPTDTAEAFYFVLSSGAKTAAEAQDVLKASLMAAAMGLGTATDVTRTLLSILMAFDIELENAGMIMGQFVEMVKAGTAEPDEMAGSLNRLLPIAKALGIEFDQLGAGIAAITVITGASGPRAIMAMLGAMRSMLRGSKRQREMLKGVNWSLKELIQLVNVDFGAAMRELGKRFDGNVALLKKFLGSTEGVNAVLALSADEGVALYTESLERMQKAGKDWLDTQAKFEETREFKLKQNFVELRVEAIRMGRALQPVFDALIGGLGKLTNAARFMITAFQAMPKPMQIGIIALAGLAAAAGPVLMISGMMAGALVTLIVLFKLVSFAILATVGSFLLLGAAVVVAALGAMWVIDNWGLVADMLGRFFKWLPRAWLAVQKAMIDITVAMVKAILQVIGSMFTAIGNAFRSIGKSSTKSAAGVSDSWRDSFEVIEEENVAYLASGQKVTRAYYEQQLADQQKFSAAIGKRIVESNEEARELVGKSGVGALLGMVSPETAARAREAGEAAGKELAEGMEEGVEGGAGGVADAVEDILRDFRDQVSVLHNELGRLAGIDTVESVAEDLREAELELERLGLEEAADRARAAREAQIESLDAQTRAIREASGEVEKTIDPKRIKAYRHEVERRLKAMQRHRKELRKQRSPEEKRIALLNKEAKVLARLGKIRNVEREIMVLRGKKVDKTLATDMEVMAAMGTMLPKISELTAAINRQADALWTRYVPALEDAAGAGGGMGSELDKALSELTEAFGDLEMDTVLEQIQKDVEEAMDELVASLTPDLEGYFKEHWMGMTGAGIGGGIGLAFGGPLGAVIGAAVGAMIGHLAQKFGPAILDWFKEHWQEVLKTAVLFFFTGLPGMIIANKFGIRDKIGDLLGVMFDAFKDWFADLVTWFAARVVDFATWGKSMAISFVEAIIEGIKDLGGLFGDALKGLVKAGIGKLPGPLKGAAEGALGIAGVELQHGMWEVPSVMPALLHPKEMVLPAGPAEMVRDAVGGGGRGGSLEVSVNVSGFGDYQSMKQRVLVEVEEQMDANAARAGVASPLVTQGVGVPRL